MSVTTSVGDLHKAPFQSCSERRARADDRVSRRGGGGELMQTKGTKTGRVTDRSVGKIRGKRDGLVVKKDKKWDGGKEEQRLH